MKDLQKEKASLTHMKAKEQAQLMHQLHAQAQHVTAQSSTQALPQMVPRTDTGQRRSRSVHAVRLRDYLSVFIY